jgi:hypothetical protein
MLLYFGLPKIDLLMMSFKARAEALGRTENEIKSEMAASLGRISGTLQQFIDRLCELRCEIESLSGPASSGKVENYRSLHSQAKLYYWYLMVQREAIGIRNHDSLPELYPIPESI